MSTKATQYHPFMRSLSNALKSHCGQPEHIMVAVSGGADSVGLLRGLIELSKKRNWQMTLSVLHVQHHVRNKAEHDAQFVKGLAESHNLPFFRADLSLNGSLQTISENQMRIARYVAFEKLAREYKQESGNYPAIASAHHADDQLETMLLRLIRGTSPKGLAAMNWRRTLNQNTHEQEIELIRPLLEITRDTIMDYLKLINQDWCEDESNLDKRFARNRLRHDVLPVLKEINPQAVRHAQALSSQLYELSDKEISDHVLTGCRSNYRLLSEQKRKHLLREFLLENNIPSDKLSRSLINQMAKAIGDNQGGRRTFDLASGFQLKITRDTFELVPPNSQNIKRPIETGVGIGKVSGSWLREVGIDNLETLKKMGSAKAFHLVRSHRARTMEKTSLNLLWALEGAVTDMHWQMITPKQKSALKRELKELLES